MIADESSDEEDCAESPIDVDGGAIGVIQSDVNDGLDATADKIGFSIDACLDKVLEIVDVLSDRGLMDENDAILYEKFEALSDKKDKIKELIILIGSIFQQVN
jgi:hypothetical protein